MCAGFTGHASLHTLFEQCTYSLEQHLISGDLEVPVLLLFPVVLSGQPYSFPSIEVYLLLPTVHFEASEVFIVSVSTLLGCSFQQPFRRFSITICSVTSSRVAFLTSSPDIAFGIAYLSVKYTYCSASFGI